MYSLSDWIEYGRRDRVGLAKAQFRRMLCAARGHVPVIDQVNNPADFPRYR